MARVRHGLGAVFRAGKPDGFKSRHLAPFARAGPALGAFGYLLDAVTGVGGGRERWKKMPWIVILFGLAVGPLGAVSILLVILQPLMSDAWCTLCLVSAFISVLMIGPALDEMMASLQHVKREWNNGKSLWNVFWGIELESPAAAREN
jgi:hypothetical protein